MEYVSTVRPVEPRGSRPTTTPAPGIMSALILLVDRDDSTREILRTAFESRGHEVLEASDGESGLRLTAEREPDLIVGPFPLDVPGHSSFEEAARRNVPDVRIVSFTGRVLGDQIEAAESVSDTVIAKPAEPLEVVAAAERLLLDR